jgi:predicted DNA-binding transcriptional regulator YafY
MSVEAMSAVWRHSQSEGRARLVLLAIADHLGEIGAWPSISTLAKMVNASPRSVQRDIKTLEELGEIYVEEQGAPTRSQYKSNLYWIILPGVTNPISGVTEPESMVTAPESESVVTEPESGVTD